MEKPYIVGPETGELSRNIEDYPGGIIVPVDKPYRWTSADVIRKVKFAAVKHFGKKNLKVGHAGTLDPLATGVLLVCIGNATKLAEELQGHEKEYVAGVSFGATTPSYDLEKDIDREFPYEHITRERLLEVLPGFVGEQNQVAPLFSAKSVDGVRAYELARKLYRQQSRSAQANEIVFDAVASGLIRASRITISEAELLAFYPAGTYRRPESAPATSTASKRINVVDTSALGLPHADIRLSCSKGTYVRAFARDLGEALGSGAHLGALRRTRSGTFNVSRCLTMERVTALLSNGIIT